MEVIIEKRENAEKDPVETPDPTQALRAELEEQFQAKEQEWSNRYKSLEEKFEENDLRWKQSMANQGQELGRYRQLFEDMQKKAEPKRSKRRGLIPDEVDPVLNQDQFQKVWKDTAELINDLTERVETLSSQASKLNEVDQLRSELKTLQGQMFVSGEERELKDEFSLSDRDIKKLRGFVEEAGLPSLKAGLMYVPEIKEKVLNKPADKPKAKQANGLGQEMLKTTEQQPTLRGGKKSDPSEGDWFTELQAALRPDGDFDSWPAEKRAQAKARLSALQRNDQVGLFK